MRITNQTTIQAQKVGYSEIQDGLIAFCAQGSSAVEMVVYRGSDYDLYEVHLHRATTDNRDFTEIAQFKNLTDDELSYTVESAWYYSTAQEAHAQFALLVASENHF